jgi:hypothetical protein
MQVIGFRIVATAAGGVIYAPTSAIQSNRIARNVPSAARASSPWITLPRPWLSERNASDRVDIHFTGRPVAFAAIIATQYSG